MNRISIASIVEGNGDVEALPVLLKRLIAGYGWSGRPEFNRPIKVKADAFRRDRDYFRGYVKMAAAWSVRRPGGMILILLDCEDDCPAVAGPRLLTDARSVRSDVPTVVGLANREFETWFLAAARSLRGRCGLPDDLEPPTDPERIRDAKGWLSERMPHGYEPVVHQREFTSHFSLDEAAAVPSFARLRRHFKELLSRQ